jgi:hypothetical protein
LTEKADRNTQSQNFNELITAKIKGNLLEKYPLMKLKIFDTAG